jgi:hypothetical protein
VELAGVELAEVELAGLELAEVAAIASRVT